MSKKKKKKSGIYSGILFRYEKKENSFIWMDAKKNKSDRKKNIYDLTYIENLKKNKNRGHRNYHDRGWALRKWGNGEMLVKKYNYPVKKTISGNAMYKQGEYS